MERIENLEKTACKVYTEDFNKSINYNRDYWYETTLEVRENSKIHCSITTNSDTGVTGFWLNQKKGFSVSKDKGMYTVKFKEENSKIYYGLKLNVSSSGSGNFSGKVLIAVE